MDLSKTVTLQTLYLNNTEYFMLYVLRPQTRKIDFV